VSAAVPSFLNTFDCQFRVDQTDVDKAEVPSIQLRLPSDPQMEITRQGRFYREAATLFEKAGYVAYGHSAGPKRDPLWRVRLDPERELVRAQNLHLLRKDAAVSATLACAVWPG